VAIWVAFSKDGEERAEAIFFSGAEKHPAANKGNKQQKRYFCIDLLRYTSLYKQIKFFLFYSKNRKFW
jgi:hypothetical protein